MGKIYGYCRKSRKEQNIERQVRNIKARYPEAIIVKEAFTGTKIDRPEFSKLLKRVAEGDTIVFDSVSRMSRNSDEGVSLYKTLFKKNIELVFLKEPLINTETYRNALDNNNIPMTGTDVDIILEAVVKYLMRLAEAQIKIAFDQAEKEVEDLRQRTREGIETARLNGKQIGGVTGVKLTTKKSIEAKKDIIKYSKAFEGNLNDKEVMKMTRLARNTYYKYKRQLLAEQYCEENIGATNNDEVKNNE